MINVKEEKISPNVSPATKPTSGLEVMKSSPATIVNRWARSFKKWLDVLSTWKSEASLIDRLISMSILGEDRAANPLMMHHQNLKQLVGIEIKNLETEILDMQQNLDLLQRYVINTDVRIKEIKLRMQKLSESYTDLKLKIFHDLAKGYPIRIF